MGAPISESDSHVVSQMMKVFHRFNRPVLIVGALAAVGVWCLSLAGFISTSGETKSEALLFVIAWPVVYVVAVLFLIAMLSLLDGEITTKVFGKHTRALGFLAQLCVLIGLPGTLLYHMILGMMGKG